MSTTAATPADKDSFIAGMRQLGAATCVITVGSDSIDASGLTATAVCSVSANPPTLLVCINAEGETNKKIRDTGHFCVNILSESQTELALAFDDPRRKQERFQLAETISLKSDCPAIVGASAQIDCELDAAHPGGDSHTIFVGQVLECRVSGAAPLLFQNGEFGIFEPFDKQA